MNPAWLRRLGQLLTALSVGVIAYATLSPSVTAGGSDTLGHFLLFIPLGAGSAFWMALLPDSAQPRVTLLLLLIVIGFAAATELAQGPITNRTPAWSDWFADVLGGTLGVAIGRLISGRATRIGSPRRP